MPDFHQNGIVTTMHDLGTTDRDRLERLLVDVTRNYKIGLVLPVTASDMRAAPFGQIVEKLQGAQYIDTIAVVLGVAPDRADYEETKGIVDREERVQPFLETLDRMEGANRLYSKFGFEQVDKPVGDTGHFGCDRWLIKDL